MPIVLNPITPHLETDIAVEEERQWLRMREEADRTVKKMYETTSGTSTNRKRKQLMRNFLRNPKAKLSAACKAIGGSPERDTVTELRKHVDPWQSEYPSITWYNKKKAKHDGSVRPICILPENLKAVHYMIAEVLKSQYERRDALYGITGHSRDDAAKEIKSLQAAGYVYLAKTDIINCFQTINPNSLYSLPLPKEVIKNALDLRHMNFTQRIARTDLQGDSLRFCAHTDNHKASGPSGLMQGSPASNIILAWLLSGLPSESDAKVILCFDNIIVAARTAAGSREMVDTLTAHFERCPAGPLALCDAEYADNESMEFLGYVFDPFRKTIGINPNALNRLEARLTKAEAEDDVRLRNLMKNHKRQCQKNPLFRSIDPFANDYPLEVWKILLSFRAGFPAASADGPELSYYLETSEHVATMRGNNYTRDLHRNLFAQKDTTEAARLRNLMNWLSVPI
ncbi:hypothetical protein [Roseibium sp.]|uniref:hypothetical protein n=1 Tax=Roseibium sp. TaxID=1936156 RepID=UPI003298289E